MVFHCIYKSYLNTLKELQTVVTSNDKWRTKRPICILKYKYFVLLQCVTIWSWSDTVVYTKHNGTTKRAYESKCVEMQIFSITFLCFVFTSFLTFANNRWWPVRQILCIIRHQVYFSAVFSHNFDAMFSCPILQDGVSTLLTTRLLPPLCIYSILYTGSFTTLGHNCRRWFPRPLWWKKFI